MIAAINWGTEALILGNLMMFASGFFANSPSCVRASSIRWFSGKTSEKLANILAAKEISLVSKFIWELLVNAFTIGNKERVAKAGASSVIV